MRKHLLAGLFGSFAIFCLGYIGKQTGYPLLIAPFGASCVLLFGFPESPLVKFKNLAGGHVLSSVVGLLFLAMSPGSLEMMALAVGVSISLMLITKTAHPAAGANPLLIMMTKADWLFLVFPILTGVLILALLGIAHQKILRFSFLKS